MAGTITALDDRNDSATAGIASAATASEASEHDNPVLQVSGTNQSHFSVVFANDRALDALVPPSHWWLFLIRLVHCDGDRIIIAVLSCSGEVLSS